MEKTESKMKKATAVTESATAVTESATESISERLSGLEGLYFPRAQLSSALNPNQRKALLGDLLSRDAAVFLERYGSKLTSEELGEFESLNEDYEINWHLKHLRSLISPTTEELRSRSATVKNRRLAYLNKMVLDGNYFSDDAMREREPYLHHEYVGKFQDPIERSMPRPGERWSETLLRRSEEAILVAKIRGEQQMLGVPEADWIGNEVNDEEEEEEGEEEEEEEEEEDEEANGTSDSAKVLENNPDPTNGTLPKVVRNRWAASVSAEEQQDLMEQFTNIMQQKFLGGEDYEHLDYSKIDEDETLDDHWLKEANQDAEEKYFDKD